MKQRPFERLSDILARFKRLSCSTQIFATEQDVKKYGHTRPGELRDMLLSELQFLKAQHVAFEKVWCKSFKDLEYVLRHAKDVDLREHVYRAHEDLAIIRRSLFRSELAGWTDRELLDEWHEWESMRRFQGNEAHDGIREERQELLRSELTSRGMGKKLRKKISEVMDEDAPAQKQTLEADMVVSAQTRAQEPTADSATKEADAYFEDWDKEFCRMVEQEADFYERALSEIHGYDAFGAHNLPLLKKHKRAQAEKRHLRGAVGV